MIRKPLALLLLVALVAVVGLAKVESPAIEAGATRLRPVLLTATTTILGLIPMATGVSFNFRTFELITRSESAQWWKSMAIVVVFGLAFTTTLTLVFQQVGFNAEDTDDSMLTWPPHRTGPLDDRRAVGHRTPLVTANTPQECVQHRQILRSSHLLTYHGMRVHGRD